VRQGSLLIARDIDIGFANNSILLATGNVRVAHENDCVIIAGGVAQISHSRRNVIAAGHAVQVSFDGDPRAAIRQLPPGVAAGAGAAPAVPANASVLLSGGLVDVSHMTGSICAAGAAARVSHASDAVFVNVPKVDVGGRPQQVKQVNGAKLPSAPRPKANPLEGRLTLTQVVPPRDDRRGAMAIARLGDAEIVLRPGRPIRDAAGKAVGGLEEWTLSFVGDDLALFAKTDGQFALFDLTPAK
jgi:hypothetical protein